MFCLYSAVSSLNPADRLNLEPSGQASVKIGAAAHYFYFLRVIETTPERWKHLMKSVLGVDVDAIIARVDGRDTTVLDYCTGYRACNTNIVNRRINSGVILDNRYVIFGR